MNNIKSFFPILIGGIIISISYYMGSLIAAHVEADKTLASKIAMLLEKQNIDHETSNILNGSVNSLLVNNHALLFQSIDVIWAIGVGVILLLFPYHVLFGQDK
jgi:hypothetical protein